MSAQAKLIQICSTAKERIVCDSTDPLNVVKIRYIEIFDTNNELIPSGSTKYPVLNTGFIGDGNGFISSYFTDLLGNPIVAPLSADLDFECSCIKCNEPKAYFTSNENVNGEFLNYNVGLGLNYNNNEPLSSPDQVSFSVKIDDQIIETIVGDYSTDISLFASSITDSIVNYATGTVGEGSILNIDIDSYIAALGKKGSACVCLCISVYDVETNSYEVNAEGKETCFTIKKNRPVARITDTYTGVTLSGDFDGTFELKENDNTTALVIGDQVKLTVTSKDTGVLIGEGVFNYGDDLNSATPISETNFTTNLQPYFPLGSNLVDGGIYTFIKKPAAKAYHNNNSGALAGINKGEDWIFTIEAYDTDQCSWSNNVDNTTELQKLYIKEGWDSSSSRGSSLGTFGKQANIHNLTRFDNRTYPLAQSLDIIHNGTNYTISPATIAAATTHVFQSPETEAGGDKTLIILPKQNDPLNNWFNFEPTMITDGKGYGNGINYVRFGSSNFVPTALWNETNLNYDMLTSYRVYSGTQFGTLADASVWIGSTPLSSALSGTQVPFTTIATNGNNVFQNFSFTVPQEGIYNIIKQGNNVGGTEQFYTNFQIYLGSY